MHPWAFTVGCRATSAVSSRRARRRLRRPPRRRLASSIGPDTDRRTVRRGSHGCHVASTRSLIGSTPSTLIGESRIYAVAVTRNHSVLESALPATDWPACVVARGGARRGSTTAPTRAELPRGLRSSCASVATPRSPYRAGSPHGGPSGCGVAVSCAPMSRAPSPTIAALLAAGDKAMYEHKRDRKR